MGEIGIPRNDFLYKLRFWEINAIIKGYRRRYREHWEMMRYLGLTFCNLMGAKLNSVQDYLPWPWDDKFSGKELTEEEVNELLELMRKENEAIDNDQSSDTEQTSKTADVADNIEKSENSGIQEKYMQ